MLVPRRFIVLAIVSFCSLFYLYHALDPSRRPQQTPVAERRDSAWALKQHYPVTSVIQLPATSPSPLPRVQHEFATESSEDGNLRLQRQSKIKENLVHTWPGYKRYARGRDKLSPISKGARDPFGGWAATLVDTLDTLWIMDLKDEFETAVE